MESFDKFINENNSMRLKSQKDRSMKRLLTLLSSAIEESEKLGSMYMDMEEPADIFDGNEADSIASSLRKIYNGFMTGDRNDDEFEDQEFK